MPHSDILVISPHPDDLEIGMGGTVAKFAERGLNIISVIVTDGRSSTNSMNLSKSELASVRKREAEKSSKILGVSELITFDLPDIKSDENQKSYSERLQRVLELKTPVKVYFPHPEIDKHVTHQIVSSIFLDVLAKTGIKPDLWCYEVWSAFPYYDHLEDISVYVNKKREAVNQHSSQIAYKNYTEGIIGLNRYRAVFCDFYEKDQMEYAEVFIRF